MSATYTISALAQEFDITSRTLRFYEEKGMLNPARCGQQRIYSAGDRVALKLILRGKRLGFSLQESSDIINMYQPGGQNIEQLETLVTGIRQKKDQLLAKQRDIVSALQDLEASEHQCLQAIGAITAQTTKPSPLGGNA